MAADKKTGSIPNRVFMWTNPRSLSTAFAKCISFIDGVQIWHEPYLACYFNKLFSNPDDMAKFPKLNCIVRQFMEVAKSLKESGHVYQDGNLSPAANFTMEWVNEQVEKPLPEGKKVMFIKDFPFGFGLDFEQLPKVSVKHTFLIRHPNRTTLSARRAMMELYEHKGAPDEFNLGEGNPFMAWEKLPPNPVYRMYNYVCENIDPNPIIVDADDLQNHPEDIMTKYCEAVGIPFEKKHLQWDKSDENLKYFYGSMEQMVWGKKYHVYDAAFRSTSFLPCKTKIPESVPPGCESYAEEFFEGFDEMYNNRLKPN